MAEGRGGDYSVLWLEAKDGISRELVAVIHSNKILPDMFSFMAYELLCEYYKPRVICGADGWTEIEEFGHAKQDWLQKFLELPNGIPSHDTIGRVFSRLLPGQFQRSFQSWITSISTLTEGQVIAIDGKTLRHSYDRGRNKAAIHMVSAWARENHLI